VWDAWKRRAAALQQDTYALYLAAQDPAVPRAAKVLLAVIVGYALSPIDLIPDFVPILGYLDDLVLLPLGIAMAVRLIPPQVWTDCKARAGAELASTLPRNRAAAAVIMALWLAIAGLAVFLVGQWLAGPAGTPSVAPT
jgi:uncharacterized membrane protein YkvA (DUF1232 family)